MRAKTECRRDNLALHGRHRLRKHTIVCCVLHVMLVRVYVCVSCVGGCVGLRTGHLQDGDILEIAPKHVQIANALYVLQCCTICYGYLYLDSVYVWPVSVLASSTLYQKHDPCHTHASCPLRTPHIKVFPQGILCFCPPRLAKRTNAQDEHTLQRVLVRIISSVNTDMLAVQFRERPAWSWSWCRLFPYHWYR